MAIKLSLWSYLLTEVFHYHFLTSVFQQKT